MDGHRKRHQLGGEQHHRTGCVVISLRRRLGTADDKRVPSTPIARNPPVPSYFMTTMKTSTIFAACGIICGLTSATLGFAGNHGRPDCSDSPRASGASPHSSWTEGAAMTTEYSASSRSPNASASPAAACSTSNSRSPTQ